MTQHQRPKGLQLRQTAMVARTAEAEEPLLPTLLKNCGKGFLCFLGTGLLLLPAMTGFACTQPDPASLVPALSLAALLPAGFMGGLITARLQGESPLLCGVVEGGMVTVCSILLSLILRGLPASVQSLLQAVLLHGAVVLFCVLGAFAGNVKRKARPGKRRFG